LFDIESELKKLPSKPGVYIMKAKDEIIYVGKAVSLKNRVRSYFRESAQNDPKVFGIVKNITEFEYIVTDNEMEALILECNLIKEHRPRFNTLLKNSKEYPYIKVTTQEMYPKIFMVHQHVRDKNKYFGPYTNVKFVHQTISLIHDIWKFRTCHKKFPRDFNKDRTCLNAHIDKCIAPCEGNVSHDEYMEMMNQAIDLLNGKHDKIIKNLENEMLEYAENLEFEKAGDLRDKITAVKSLSERQKVVSENPDDHDIIAFTKAHDEALFQVFFVRGGKMIGREQFLITNVENDTRPDVMLSFIKQFYNENSYLPKELIIEEEIEDKELISKWLSEMKESTVTITTPQKGTKSKLIDMAHKNAILSLEQFGEKFKLEHKKTVGALKELQKTLNISTEIKRIEAYDISNTYGVNSVGSMIVYENGKPKRNDYRKFKIKGIVGADDYGSMKEVLTRRFLRYKTEQEDILQGKEIKEKFSSLPDILFIDGGKGHVNAVLDALDELDVDIYVCGMVKDDRHRTRGLIFNGEEIIFARNSEAFKLVTRIQDEVHRFAVEYHRKLQEKILISSALDNIPQIGEKRKRELLKHFGSVENIRKASLEEISEVTSMDKKASLSLYNHFK